jgi:DNA-directed RNA polymerase specialized sigma subunit
VTTETKILTGARVRPLTLRQQQELARAAQEGDKRAGAKLVESCLGLVVAAATEHGRKPIVRDMVQNGVLEMLERLYGRPNKRYPDREVVRYDPERGIKFWTFVRLYVLAAILDTFEKPRTWSWSRRTQPPRACGMSGRDRPTGRRGRP